MSINSDYFSLVNQHFITGGLSQGPRWVEGNFSFPTHMSTGSGLIKYFTFYKYSYHLPLTTIW